MKSFNFKRVLENLFSLLFLCLISYFFYLNFVPTDPCSQVLTFRLATIDSRFGLSRDEAIKYAIAASNLWNDSLHKQVLTYDENGKVEITFVYDERQRKTIENNILQAIADNQANELKITSKNILIEKQNFDQAKALYENDLQNFETRLKTYNDQIESINKKGGATPEQIPTLNNERAELQSLANQLENRRVGLNTYLDSLNTDVSDYNSIVKNVNTVINKINSNSLGEFEEGIYSDNKITLFEYPNITDLERLLAHEFGHALGLDHTSDPNSIMYYINRGSSLSLTQADLDEYNKVCDSHK